MFAIHPTDRTVLLLRHGLHDEVGRVLSGRSEMPLNTVGLAQAQAIAARPEIAAVRSIHSSPRRRTLQTAKPIAERLGLPVTLAPALDEIDFGRFAGQSFDALADDPDWHRWNAERGTARCPGGETMREAVDRALDYVARIPAALLPAVCVSHCDIIRGIVAQALGYELHEVLTIDCDPGSITMITFEGSKPTVASVNAVPAP